MRDILILLIHVVTTVLRAGRPGGVRAVIAESVLARHQLLILKRSRRRAPNLRILDRIIAGFCSLWIQPCRLARVAVAFKTSTLLNFHRALVNRKYRLLFSPKQRAKLGRKGPPAELIHAVLEMKERNPSWGCPQIADQINCIHAGAVNGEALCRRLKQAIRGVTTLPRHLSSDHDPLYRFHQWQANLRVLGITEIKTVPFIPFSHPFVERLIGTIRRECLDRTLFWTTVDLERKLLDFQRYYNGHRTHTGRSGRTPDSSADPTCVRATVSSYRWQVH